MRGYSKNCKDVSGAILGRVPNYMLDLKKTPTCLFSILSF